MTFKHKLSCRLAMVHVTVAAAVWAGCNAERGVLGPRTPVVQILTLPESLTIEGGQSTQFAAIGRDTSGASIPVDVRWSATGGTITSDGLFTADTVEGTFQVRAQLSSGVLSGHSTVH